MSLPRTSRLAVLLVLAVPLAMGAAAAELPDQAKPSTQAPLNHGRGSVYASAAPGPGVPTLGLVGPALREVSPTEPVVVTVRAVAGAEVAFATADGGRFIGSGADHEVVTAGPDGLATATWECTPGVTDDVHLAAASPACVGRVDLLISLVAPGAQP